MKINTHSCVLGGMLLALNACSPDTSNHNKNEPIATTVSSVGFDSIMAKEFGADQYGMRKYVIAFLYRGENQSLDSLEKIRLQSAHMENIGKMADAGKLALAGPFFGKDDLRGIYIFNVPTIEEAQRLTETDPAIQAGTLRMELKEWYGSAALMGVNETHKRIAKVNI